MEILATQGNEQAAEIAHVLRRCGFGPAPGMVERWMDDGVDALIDWLLANDETGARADDELFDGLGDPDELDQDVFVTMFLDQMMSRSNPLHERMTWYWHTHFTSSVETSDNRYAWRQHHLLRRMALGNFATMAKAVSTDPAMLFYLDGAGSYGENPNENYAREFLELFTLGRDGGYVEDDVRAAARIFAGWNVNWETAEVEFNRDASYTRPVTFMGERRRWTLEAFVDFVCELPACHRHVATRVYHHLVGPDLSAARRDELAQVFADSGLEVKALVAAILRSPDFLAARHARARQPLEWMLGALQALGFTSTTAADLQYWHIDVLGQMPFLPPNVAGWPLDNRWASASQVIARTSLLLDWQLPETTINSVPPTVDEVLGRCGIYDPSPSTRAALDKIEQDFSEFDYRLELLFSTVLTSPEFALL